MGSITISGKGSRSRVKDRVGFRANFDEINWPSKGKHDRLSQGGTRAGGSVAGVGRSARDRAKDADAVAPDHHQGR